MTLLSETVRMSIWNYSMAISLPAKIRSEILFVRRAVGRLWGKSVPGGNNTGSHSEDVDGSGNTDFSDVLLILSCYPYVAT